MKSNTLLGPRNWGGYYLEPVTFSDTHTLAPVVSRAPLTPVTPVVAARPEEPQVLPRNIGRRLLTPPSPVSADAPSVKEPDTLEPVVGSADLQVEYGEPLSPPARNTAALVGGKGRWTGKNRIGVVTEPTDIPPSRGGQLLPQVHCA